jgi:hypothetical protein
MLHRIRHDSIISDDGGSDGTTGTAKLKIREMGSRYLSSAFMSLLQKYFSRGD